MKQEKFLLKIPDGENFIEHKFDTINHLCEFLNITHNTAYSLRSQRLKLKHKNKKHLEGIRIEKIPVFYSSKPNTEEIEKTKEDYHKELKSKLIGKEEKM
jgi:CRISPR/Cas system-associated protein Cas10 (large subunit of type III CRISPR-Cas system)